ncbi:MAG: 1-acyl-sn-glycerol-3-phosphate acyltransferase [Myxococcota bacterium]|jgi:1-acyl-sn-glycerol-3-phosphate acyltransferase|nr:1-acyl-sn-glycerol-3-phosphate acyltransferase [Myxococcota bacterium]
MIRRWFGTLILKIFGWKAVGGAHFPKRCVVLAHPHTSNLDFLIFLVARWSIQVRCHWVGKHTLFWPPLGWIMRFLDGVPVNRSGGRDSVSAIADAIEKRDTIALAIAPSGSRSRGDHWRSGFYHIAKKADVPILLGFVDYKTKTVGLSDFSIQLTDNMKADMDRFREFYQHKTGRFPEQQNPIRLKAESEA